MKRESVKDFYNYLKESENVRRELEENLKKHTLSDMKAEDQEAIILRETEKIAKKYNFEVTKDDLANYLKEAGKELPEEDLLNVAGGMSATGIAMGFLMLTGISIGAGAAASMVSSRNTAVSAGEDTAVVQMDKNYKDTGTNSDFIPTLKNANSLEQGDIEQENKQNSVEMTKDAQKTTKTNVDKPGLWQRIKDFFGIKNNNVLPQEESDLSKEDDNTEIKTEKKEQENRIEETEETEEIKNDDEKGVATERKEVDKQEEKNKFENKESNETEEGREAGTAEEREKVEGRPANTKEETEKKEDRTDSTKEETEEKEESKNDDEKGVDTDRKEVDKQEEEKKAENQESNEPQEGRQDGTDEEQEKLIQAYKEKIDEINTKIDNLPKLDSVDLLDVATVDAEIEEAIEDFQNKLNTVHNDYILNYNKDTGEVTIANDTEQNKTTTVGKIDIKKLNEWTDEKEKKLDELSKKIKSADEKVGQNNNDKKDSENKVAQNNNDKKDSENKDGQNNNDKKDGDKGGQKTDKEIEKEIQDAANAYKNAVKKNKSTKRQALEKLVDNYKDKGYILEKDGSGGIIEVKLNGKTFINCRKGK